MHIWKYLHILSMFSGVTLLVGGGIYFEAVARTGDASVIAKVGKAFKPLENAGIAFVSAGVIFGLVYATVGHFGLTSPWLIVAYVLVAALYTLGPMESAKVKKIVDAAEAGDTTTMQTLIADKTRNIFMAVSILIYIGVIYDMVIKPF